MIVVGAEQSVDEWGMSIHAELSGISIILRGKRPALISPYPALAFLF